MQVNRTKSSVKGCKTLLLRTKILKSSAYINKQKQTKYKMV